MKPLDKMAKKEKAIMMFNLFPLEMVPFIVFCRSVAEKVMRGQQKVRIDFLKNKPKGTDEKETARLFIHLLNDHEKEIVSNAVLFADYLLANEVAYFTLFCTYDYIESERCENVDFPLAANLFLL